MLTNMYTVEKKQCEAVGSAWYYRKLGVHVIDCLCVPVHDFDYSYLMHKNNSTYFRLILFLNEKSATAKSRNYNIMHYNFTNLYWWFAS